MTLTDWSQGTGRYEAIVSVCPTKAMVTATVRPLGHQLDSSSGGGGAGGFDGHPGGGPGSSGQKS